MTTPDIEELISMLRSKGCPDWVTARWLMESAAGLLSSQAERIKELESECEVERLRLAACGVAALGYFDGCKDEYKSASLDDVLRLNKRCADLRAELGDLPEAQAEMLAEIKRLRAQLAEIENQEPVAIALNTGTKQGVKWLRNVPHGEKLFTRPMPAQPADHEARELVNRLTAIAKEFHGAQQLRERIANEIRPFTLVKPAQGVTLSLTDAEIAEVQASDPIYMTCSCMKFAWDILAAANAKGAK